MTDAADPIPLVTATDPAAGSGDVVAANIAALKRLFPAALTDGGVDFNALRQLLGGAVEDGEERYGLTWMGKRRARAFALTPSLGTLRPAQEDGFEWDTTRNVVIESDNAEALKLLSRGFAGKIKLIYIDPPYNTGNDFVYKDDYRDSIGNYYRLTGQISVEGAATVSDREAAGRLHTEWLTMMYPRLYAAKQLLTLDGVILVSIDEKELANLTMVCCEIFGEENAVGTIVWKASTDNNPTRVAIEHEYVICFARDKSALSPTWKNGSDEAKQSLSREYDRIKSDGDLSMLEIQQKIRAFIRQNKDALNAITHYDRVDEGGLYTGSRKVHNPKPGGYRYDVLHPITNRPCVVPVNGYRYPEDTMKDLLGKGKILFGEDENQIIQVKEYLGDYEGKLSSVLNLDSRSGANELDALMGVQKLFSNPKPVPLLTSLFDFIVEKDDIVLDFFAGSGTTGHAVMAQNALDGGHRRYLLVQLPEALDPAKKEQKIAAAFCDEINKPRTIAELTKERLRRAGAKLRAEHPNADLDTGFRVYKLATSNLKPWQPDPNDLEASLLDAIDNVLPGRTEDDLLVELLLKTGIDLSLSSEARSIAGANVHALGGGVLMVCLADIAEDQAEALGQGMCDWRAELDPPRATTFYFKDAGFESAATKANLAAIIRQRVSTGVEKLASL